MGHNGGVSHGTERQRDAERTRAELLAEATRAFAESGYSGTRVDEIAERTRTTKRMIYYYFGSKEGLYLAVLEAAYRGIRDAERELEVGALSPVEAVRRIAEITFDHHLAHSDFIRLVAVENIHHGRFIRQIPSIREANQPALGLLEEVLERGREQGVFAAGIEPLEVHLLISSYCVFQVANQHTFGYIFGVEFAEPQRRERLRRMIGDVVVAWLSAPRTAG